MYFSTRLATDQSGCESVCSDNAGCLGYDLDGNACVLWAADGNPFASGTPEGFTAFLDSAGTEIETTTYDVIAVGCMRKIQALIDCNVCSQSFLFSGGCGCLTDDSCEISMYISQGCDVCEDEALEICNTWEATSTTQSSVCAEAEIFVCDIMDASTNACVAGHCELVIVEETTVADVETTIVAEETTTYAVQETTIAADEIIEIMADTWPVECGQSLQGSTIGLVSMFGRGQILTFTAGEAYHYIFDACQSRFDTILRLYGASGNEIAVNDDDHNACSHENTRASFLEVTLTPGENYTLEIDGWGQSEGEYELDIYCAEDSAEAAADREAAVSERTTTTTTTTTSVQITTTSIAGSGIFSVSGDGCEVQGDCVSSTNYPNPHGNNEGCTVRALRDAYLAVNETFAIETCCDNLIVDMINVDFAQMVPYRINANSTVSWTTDTSVTSSGWQICFSDEPTRSTTSSEMYENVGSGYCRDLDEGRLDVYYDAWQGINSWHNDPNGALLCQNLCSSLSECLGYSRDHYCYLYVSNGTVLDAELPSQFVAHTANAQSSGTEINIATNHSLEVGCMKKIRYETTSYPEETSDNAEEITATETTMPSEEFLDLGFYTSMVRLNSTNQIGWGNCLANYERGFYDSEIIWTKLRWLDKDLMRIDIADYTFATQANGCCLVPLGRAVDCHSHFSARSQSVVDLRGTPYKVVDDDTCSVTCRGHECDNPANLEDISCGQWRLDGWNSAMQISCTYGGQLCEIKCGGYGGGCSLALGFLQLELAQIETSAASVSEITSIGQTTLPSEETSPITEETTATADETTVTETTIEEVDCDACKQKLMSAGGCACLFNDSCDLDLFDSDGCDICEHVLQECDSWEWEIPGHDCSTNCSDVIRLVCTSISDSGECNMHESCIFDHSSMTCVDVPLTCEEADLSICPMLEGCYLVFDGMAITSCSTSISPTTPPRSSSSSSSTTRPSSSPFSSPTRLPSKSLSISPTINIPTRSPAFCPSLAPIVIATDAPEPVCEDGEMDNSDPCEPKECVENDWVSIIVDCAEQMGMECLAGWMPAVEGTCCSTCPCDDIMCTMEVCSDGSNPPVPEGECCGDMSLCPTEAPEPTEPVSEYLVPDEGLLDSMMRVLQRDYTVARLRSAGQRAAALLQEKDEDGNKVAPLYDPAVKGYLQKIRRFFKADESTYSEEIYGKQRNQYNNIAEALGREVQTWE